MNRVLIIPKGYEIKCPDGHLIGTFTCDKFYKEPLFEADTKWEPGNEIKMGGEVRPCATCGKDWFTEFKLCLWTALDDQKPIV